MSLSQAFTYAASSQDSLFQDYSIEDLVEFQDYYARQTERLLAQKNELRLKAIQDLEAFLEGHPDSPILDKILIRLAELHYQQAVYDYGVALDQLSNGAGADSLYASAEEAVLDYSRALELYQQIIDEFPNSHLNDEALYNRAFLFEDLGQRQRAYPLFERLVTDYPESPFVPDAYMRMAEYHFNPPERELERAIELYDKLLTFKESPRYDAALYRLGWSYYILNDHVRAISYFTLLADDIERTRQLDPEQKHHFPPVRDEAVEYIGISFLDFGGTHKASYYFEEIGGRDYGFEVLKKIGDSYMDVKEEYANAVEAYQLMLSMYPDAPQAPFVQARIAEAYHAMEQEDVAYATRTELFQKYRAGSDWWENVEDVDVKAEAAELAERALRDNISLLLKKAEDTGDTALYEQAVNNAKQYLETFPDDSNTVRIHWNMALTLDSKLGQRERAFEEYIAISNRYSGSEFQKQAAENAIALQDEALRQDSTSVSSSGTLAKISEVDSTAAQPQLQPQSFSETEKKLAYALDNYVRLFPHEPETAKILAKSGAVYYEHHQFDEALKYFKTLTRHFPESAEADNAQYLTMESYFGKGDYESTEKMAHQVRDVAPEFADKANKRLAESIFQRAKTFADVGAHARAADEYRRMVIEAPTGGLADRALYNAGLQYDEAGAYDKAINSYDELLNTYPESEHYLDAMNNLAFDYREIKDFILAAETYARLAELTQDPEQAQVALYNASISYVQAQEWLRAIAVNNKFVERFPDAEDADDLLFKNAGYYLKMNDLASANDIYARFSEKYPDSPRVVEALYHRGDYFQRNGRLGEARVHFQDAIDKSVELQKGGKGPNEFYACEALYQLTEIKYEEFDKLKFKLPEPILEANKKRKKDLLLELVDNYTQVASYGTIRLYQSTFRVGQVYEKFATTWLDQDIPPMGETEEIMARQEISTTAADLFEKAVEAYKDGMSVLQRLAQAEADSARLDTSKSRLAKLAADTTGVTAEQWVARSREKVSETLYKIAETQYTSLENLLQAPIPTGLSKLEELVYQQQVLLKAVHPITQEILEAHRRNLSESRGLNLENHWLERSQTEITRVGTIVPDEFLRLRREALLAYNAEATRFDALVEAGDEAAFDFSEQLRSYVELSAALTLGAAQVYKQQSEHVRNLGLETPETQATEQQLMRVIFVYSETADSLANHVENRRKYYKAKFEESDNIDYEDAYFVFDDLVFTFDEKSQQALEFGFNVSRDLGIANEWTQKLVWKVVKRDPEQYAAELGLEIETDVVSSSADWRVSSQYENGWTHIDFVDSSWSQAITDGPAGQLTAHNAESLWFTTLAKSEKGDAEVVEAGSKSPTNGQKADMAFVRPERLYFRKVFKIEGMPVDGSIQLHADDSYRLYMNGSLVSEHEHDPDSAIAVHTHNVKEYCETGDNVLALEVHDSDGSGGNLEAVLELKYLPRWFDNPSTEAKFTEQKTDSQ